VKIEVDGELEPIVFTMAFASPLDAAPTPEWLLALLDPAAQAPVRAPPEARAAVRDALRVHGYKPTGRGKPASEYLLKAAEAGPLPSINLAVDACNAVSLHSGLPISVVDRALALDPLAIRLAAADASYVFNASGQEIRLAGLVCLHDRDGPCANAVRDSQRTKTSGATRATLSIVWSPRALGDHARNTAAWCRDLLARAGATTATGG
jgi:DNA/RNA-binding domain of Phe-tRNA-synthetase-like protein